MSQCLNPDCLKRSPNNSEFCESCGLNLLLVQRYRAIKILGQGGFGRTFLAIDEFKPSQPSCVIKQFLPQAQGTDSIEKASALFAQEAEHLEKLGKHDQIPDLMANFTQNNRQYLVQEYIAGQTLAQELKEQGAFSEAKIWQLLTGILPLLQFVHENNVIHRDIKPENIIRRQDNKIVLVDFGASKFTKNKNLSVTGTVIGSAEYTAPEQAMGKAKFCSDLYSLGVTCIHLFTNVSPFDLYSIHEGDWAWRDFLVDNPVGDKLGNILDKLIESAVKRRYQTVEDVLKDLPQNQSNDVKPLQNIGTPNYATFLTTIKPAKTIQKTSTLPNSIQLKYFSFETLAFTVKSSVLFGLGKYIKSQKKQHQAKQFTLNLATNINLEMVSIPGGKFLMGSPESEDPGHNDRGIPQHWVTVPPFYVGKYPITQAQWQAIMGNNPSNFKGLNRPVEMVSWNNCVEFCQKLFQQTGLNFSLPSEAQWEYACRAGTTTPFYFGETITPELANYDGNYVYGNGAKGIYRWQTTDVGRFPPNTFGLHDMHGNVWEWCADEWHENYIDAPTDGSASISNNNNATYVIRGGSWISNPFQCRSAYRDYGNPRDCYNFNGLRVVCDVPRT